MKKEYTKPTMSVVELQYRCQLLAGSVNSLTTNLDDIVLGDGSDVDAR